jgi:photosystem II stability/assembly factor-like uncharacterized protein
MNTALPNADRRRFLTRLFTAPDETLAKTQLGAIEELRRQTDGVLWAITGDSADNIFVAGDDGVVFHFDGDSWRGENLGSKLNVHALCIRGDEVFSVGWLGRICVRRNGQWSPVQGGQNDPATINQPLFDCAASADGNLWAVGDQGRITQYDGSDWIEHKSGTGANLRSVLPLADGRVLVGGLGGMVLELADGNWRRIDTNTGCPIVSMAILNEDTVIAVGGEYSIESNQFLGRMFLYSEGNWSAVAIEEPLPRLRRVRREGNNLLITGDGGAAYRWTSEGVSRLTTRLRFDLHDVISFAEGEAMICGDSGTVLLETLCQDAVEAPAIEPGPRWKIISNGETNKTLRTLWAVGDEKLIAAGESGIVLHLDRDEITVRETPGNRRIHALWGSSPNNVYAACDSSTLLHFDGNDWGVAHQGSVDTALLAITGFGPHDIFAVGDNGYALRYDGLMWRQIETGIKQELYGLWGQDSHHLLAVGGGGTILRWDGERWKTFGAGTEQDLYGVHGSSLNKLFIAGLGGTLIRFEDNNWHREFSGVRSDLHCVAGSGEEFYVVGSNGTILRNNDGHWEPEDSGCKNTLQAVAVTSRGIFATGSGGLLLHKQA